MIGVDIVSNERIRKAIEKFGERFLKRIYTLWSLNTAKNRQIG
jgi:holo-[acyl-carrier protein] synthase